MAHGATHEDWLRSKATEYIRERDEFRTQRDELLAALKLWKKIPRPWIDRAIGRRGTLTLTEWDAACEQIERAIQRAESWTTQQGERGE